MIGLVRYITQSGSESVIHLLKGIENRTHAREVESFLKSGQDSKYFALVVETDNWTYVQTSIVRQISKHLRYAGYPKLADDLTGKEMVFSRAMDRPVTLQSKAYHNAPEDSGVTLKLNEITDMTNIGGFDFLEDDGDVPGTSRTYGDVFGSDMRDYTAEKVDAFQNEMRMNQEEARAYPPEDYIINAMMIDRYYPPTNEEAILDTANRIRDAIYKQLGIDNDALYRESIVFKYDDGYLHVLRKDLPLREIITDELLADDMMREYKLIKEEVALTETMRLTKKRIPEDKEIPELYHYEEQLGEPINHDNLKTALFLAETSALDFEGDQERLREAELILSQEYFIAINPEPRYQQWVFEKLIKLWYADNILTSEIRMIKILVNTFRARTDKVFNRENGVLPSIVIYPRYGKRSATNVIQRLSYWFSLHESAIAWKNNPPSYYKQMNELIAYTNSSNTIKMYYRYYINKKKGINSPYADNFTKIRETAQGDRDIIHQYIPLDRY
jgi:hypothetical protein